MSEENLAEKMEQQLGATINREIANNMFAEMFNGTEYSKPEYDNKLKVRLHRYYFLKLKELIPSIPHVILWKYYARLFSIESDF